MIGIAETEKGKEQWQEKAQLLQKFYMPTQHCSDRAVKEEEEQQQKRTTTNIYL